MRDTRIQTLGLLLPLLILPLVGCADPAADAPAAVVDEAAPETEGAMDEEMSAGEVYVFTPDSAITFVGSKVTGSHDGGFETFTGSIDFVDGDPESSAIDVEIDTTSLWADNERLTGHLKSADFFEVETYPTATFTSNSIVANPEGGYTITGNLDLHGVTKQISFPAQIEVAEGEIRANAEFSLKRFDFGILYPGKADDLIRDDVLVKLDLVAAPAA